MKSKGYQMIRSVGYFCVALAAVAASGALAQQYPSRAVSLVVPFPPGAATDAFARVVARRMTDTLGQQVLVINRAGAAGVIGTERHAWRSIRTVVSSHAAQGRCYTCPCGASSLPAHKAGHTGAAQYPDEALVFCFLDSGLRRDDYT
jgi:hypothetical protein